MSSMPEGSVVYQVQSNSLKTEVFQPECCKPKQETSQKHAFGQYDGICLSHLTENLKCHCTDILKLNLQSWA